MKKNALLILLVSIIATGSAFTQGTSFGVKGGLNLTSVYGDDAADDLSLGIKYSFGLAIKSSINEMFSIRTELLYTTKGFGRDLETYIGTMKVDMTYSYFEVPLYAGIKVIDGVDILLGGYVGYLINAEAKAELNGDTDSASSTEGLARLDYGALVGASFEVIDNLTIEGRLTLGLSRLDEDSKFDTKHYAIQFLVGYYFN